MEITKSMRTKRSWWIVTAVVGLAALGIGAFFIFEKTDRSSGTGQVIAASGDLYETVAPGELPSFAGQASAKVQEAYHYAVAHPEVLQYVPCFCGCGNIGHRHNADCYVKERHRDGRITFTSHAVG